MTSSSSLYGTVTQQNVSSANSTGLYGDAGTPIPDSSGNVIVRGTLTVNGCAILTNCSSFSFLPLNATSIGIGGSATSVSIGSGAGTTTINNQLATANYTFPVADGTSNQVLITDGSGVLSFADVQSLDTNYTIDASATTGGANFNLQGSDATTDTIKLADGTGVTVSRTNANEIGFAIGQSVATGATPTFAGATLGNVTVGVATDNTISTTTANLILDSATGVVNAKDIQATVGGAGPLGGLNLYSNDASNAIHIYDNFVQISSGLIPGADWAFNEDGTTTFPGYSFPYLDGTANQVLATDGSGNLAWTSVQSLDTNYTIDASATTGGANFNLQGSDATTDTIKFANGTGVAITRTSANEITITNTGVVDPYNIDATATTGGANLNLNNASGTDSVAFKGGGATTVTRTSADIITISSTDANTTYDFNATAATGGANLNLVGSDATTDTVKLTDGGHITATYTSGTVVTLGSDATSANTANAIVSRDASGNFIASGATLGVVTTGIAANNEINTTSGQLVLDSFTNLVSVDADLTVTDDLTVNGGNINLNGVATAGVMPFLTFATQPDGANPLYGIRGSSTADDPWFVGAGATGDDGGYLEIATGDNAGVAGQSSPIYARQYNGFSGTGVPWQGGTGTVVNDFVLLDGDGNTSIPNALTVGGNITGPGGTFGNITVGVATDNTIATTSGDLILDSASGTLQLADANLSSPVAQTWTVIDNNASALSIGATGKADILKIVTTDNAEVLSTTAKVDADSSFLNRFTRTATGAASNVVFEIDRYRTDSVRVGDQGSWLGFGYRGTDNPTVGTGGQNAIRSMYEAAGNHKLQFLQIPLGNYAAPTAIGQVARGSTFFNTTAGVSNLVLTDSTARIGGTSTTITNSGNTATYATFASTSTTLASAGTTYANFGTTFATFASGGVNYASLGAGSNTFTVSGLNNFIRQGTVNTTQPGLVVRYQRTDTTGPNNNDGVDFRLGVGGTTTTTNIARFDASYDGTSGNLLHTVGISVSADSFAADTDTIYRGKADKTIIRATPAGTTGTASDILTVEAAKVTSAVPIAFPVYTAAAAGAITGAVGWQISISNSPTVGGRMAFWDTTNSRWSYISDNSAV